MNFIWTLKVSALLVLGYYLVYVIANSFFLFIPISEPKREETAMGNTEKSREALRGQIVFLLTCECPNQIMLYWERYKWGPLAKLAASTLGEKIDQARDALWNRWDPKPAQEVVNEVLNTYERLNAIQKLFLLGRDKETRSRYRRTKELLQQFMACD